MIKIQKMEKDIIDDHHQEDIDTADIDREIKNEIEIMTIIIMVYHHHQIHHQCHHQHHHIDYIKKKIQII